MIHPTAVTGETGETGPVSPAQERLWFLQRLDPDDASYNMYLARRLTGALTADQVRQALDAVSARHDALRTSYPEADGVPHAVVAVAAPGAVELEVLDASASEEADADAHSLVHDRVNTPFDLTTGPPLRACLIRVGASTHLFCLVMHHICGDGTSLGILADELDRFLRGAGPTEPAPQFAPIAAELRSRERDDYWTTHLADAEPLHLLPGRPRRDAGERLGAGFEFRLAPDLVTGLETAAASSRTTLFMAFAAAFQVLLSAHTGRRDVPIGTTVAARGDEARERVVGYLASTVVLRGDLSGDPTVAELLVRTRRSVLGALAHPEVPFEDLAPGLVTTMAILHTQDGAPQPTFGGLASENVPIGLGRAKLDLILEGWRSADGGLDLLVSYDLAAFGHAEISALAQRFSLLAREFADPGRRLSEIRTLTDDDLQQLRSWEEPDWLTLRWRSRSQPQPQPESESECESRSQSGAQSESESKPQSESESESGSESRSESAPQPWTPGTLAADPTATALICGAEHLTYAELGARADDLAARLAGQGVGPGSVVGVRIPRSVAMVVALLAVHRAGAACLPLAVEDPEERVRKLQQISGASLILTGAELPSPPPVGLLIGQPAAVPEDPAYILATSGSSGTPKAVVIERGHLAARVAWMRDAYALTGADRVVQFAALTFDAHAEEIHPALAAGATLVLLPDGPLSLPDHLDGVTVLDLPTAYWHHLVAMADDVPWPPSLRLVILGGEQAHGWAVAAWRARFGDRVKLVNTYGPTEATIIATAADLTSEAETDSEAVPPIGRPIAQTRVRILDEAGRRVPPGAPGELCVGGAGVARGYLGLDDLTSSRFIPDHLGLPGERLYRTGDVARWRPDGQLVFLGRRDDQLKVRGYRIEPGEIEAVLTGCPGIGGACVAIHDEAIVAYLTGDASPEAVRGHAVRALAAHLVPTAWVMLDAFPLTASGKIDRAALPAPGTARADRPYQGPVTDAEQLVASVWSDALGVQQMAVDDDFFALGGHSLLATRVAARLRALLEIEVPLRTLFTSRTVADLAAAVEHLLVEALDALPEETAVILLEAL